MMMATCSGTCSSGLSGGACGAVFLRGRRRDGAMILTSIERERESRDSPRGSDGQDFLLLFLAHLVYVCDVLVRHLLQILLRAVQLVLRNLAVVL